MRCLTRIKIIPWTEEMSVQCLQAMRECAGPIQGASRRTSMAIQCSVGVRNARLDAIETVIGASGRLKLRSGAAPASCAAADSGTVLADITLPADWATAASGGSKAFQGTWQDAAADAAGTLGHWRLYAADGITCHMQGTITATGGGGDMTVDNTNVAVNQPVNITGFTLTDANA